MASTVSSPTEKNQNGTEWISVLKKTACLLFLLLVLWTVLIFSVLYYFQSFIFGGKEALIKSALLTHHDHRVNSSLQLPLDEAIVSTSNGSSHEILDQTPFLALGSCDVSKGKWIEDTTEPMYSNLTCPYLHYSRNCLKYGKPPGYLYWRWKPDKCELPRFDPRKFLDLVRGKTLAIVGDSIARNQYESLRCLLSLSEKPKYVYHDRSYKFQTHHFRASNFTMKVIWSEFYVKGVQINSNATSPFDIHLDKLNTNWTSELPGLDYLIISGGSWFYRDLNLYEYNRRIGCVNCQEDGVKDYGIPYAIRRVVRMALEGINASPNCDGLKTFMRTITPGHFEHGTWSTGGYCNRTQPLNESEINLDGNIDWEIRKIQIEEIKRIQGFKNHHNKHFGVLDVTKAMMIRADAHPGDYFWEIKTDYNPTDCLHWCLPGPIDMWSDMLMYNLMMTSAS